MCVRARALDGSSFVPPTSSALAPHMRGVCACECASVLVSERVFVSERACACVWTLSVPVCLCLWLWLYACACLCMRACTNFTARVRACACVRAWLCVRVCVCVFEVCVCVLERGGGRERVICEIWNVL